MLDADVHDTVVLAFVVFGYYLLWNKILHQPLQLLCDRGVDVSRSISVLKFSECLYINSTSGYILISSSCYYGKVYRIWNKGLQDPSRKML